MSLRILHLLCSNFFAGSVDYAIDLADQQVAEGHHVTVVTDMDLKPRDFNCIQLPISDRSMGQRLKNVMEVRGLLRKNDISVIHAHSRAASWVGYFARKGTRIPLVSTIHGRQRKQPIRKKMDIYGDRIIAICPDMLHHLDHELELPKEKLVLIPNGININPAQYNEVQKDPSRKVVSIIGRFNGIKGEVIAALVCEVFPQLLQDVPSLHLQFIGMEWGSFPEAGRKAFEALQHLFGDHIVHLGFKKDVMPYLTGSDLVIGAGRVALKALLVRSPVFAIGEAQCHGLVTAANIEEAIASNFGDLHPTRRSFGVDGPLVGRALLGALLNNPVSEDFSERLAAYRIQDVHRRVIDVYRQAMMKRAHRGAIPILMYHRVPDVAINTRHRTFVTRKRFEAQLRFFKMRGLISITFTDHDRFANGERSMREFPRHPFILTFDDGYKDNFQNMLPLANRFGYKGVLFLLGDKDLAVNNWDTDEDPASGQLMNIDEQHAFVQAGWEIGAHTMTHPDLRKLENGEAIREMEQSRISLERSLGIEVRTIAYPYGLYDERVKELTRAAGFTYGVATDTGGMHVEDDHFAIFRVNMFPNESILQLYKKTSSWYRSYYRRKRGV